MSTGRFAILALSLACLAFFPGCVTTEQVETATANRIYHLPYEHGTTCSCVQPGPGPFSHKGYQQYAIDFGMDEGTAVLAAREGEVVAVKEDGDQGGPWRNMAKHGNYVRVLHEDGTIASYLHLRFEGAEVEIGERVERGQRLGWSGSTGWAAMPHLHFQVDARDPDSLKYRSIPIAFLDVPGDGIPKFLEKYTADRP